MANWTLAQEYAQHCDKLDQLALKYTKHGMCISLMQLNALPSGQIGQTVYLKMGINLMKKNENCNSEEQVRRVFDDN